MSSAVKAVRALLVADPALVAVVSPNSIGTGRFQEGTQLPAVIVSHISTNWRTPVTPDATTFGRSRVQVTVFAQSYPSQDALQRLVRHALPPTRGVVNGVALDSIQPGGDGPDMRDDHANIFMGASDFIVTFNE